MPYALNADKIEIMHPSDVRMSDWNSTPTFVVGTNTDAQWPMIEFMGVNNSQRITFNQVFSNEVLGITLFTKYVLPFEVVSVLLLAALVGAVVLARKED